MFETAVFNYNQIKPLITIVDDSDLTVMSKFLYERITKPESYLVFLGETSSGKSSIIDGLLGEILLPVKASPSTAAITEIELSGNLKSDEFFAINKDATIEKLPKEVFLSLCENPDENLSRLKLRKSYSGSELRNLRIFDTPGYGSIIEEHEEVLENFLPNSDIVVYTVNYRIGIQEADYKFLGMLKELVRDDVEVILVINRCPVNMGGDDPRISEIKKYISDLLLYSPKTFCITNVPVEEGELYALPKCLDLWSYVGKTLNGKDRLTSLENAFNQYIFELYEKCDSIIQMKYTAALMAKEEKEEIIQQQRGLAHKIRLAIPKFVEPAFDLIRRQIPLKIEEARKNIYAAVENKIESSEKVKKDEIVPYINAHLLPFTTRKECNEIELSIQGILEKLNDQVDDYINKEIQDFNTKIQVLFQSNTELAARNIGKDLLKKLSTNGLGKYFAAFGGAGGANAGIANAASHSLKVVGDFFGKTFSRSTHNSLKQFLKKIGATSMKKLGAVITVVIEVVVLVIDYNTWKWRLENKVSKELSRWKEETQEQIIVDLNKLEQENYHILNTIAEQIEDSIVDDDSSINIEELKRQVKLSETIRKQIGA